MVGPVITLDLWTSGGRKQRAPNIQELRAVFEDSTPIPQLLLRGIIFDEGLPMSWTVKTRVHVDHSIRRVTVVLELSVEALPSMARVEPFERPFNVLILADPSPGLAYAPEPYEVRVYTPNARELARTRLLMVPGAQVAQDPPPARQLG